MQRTEHIQFSLSALLPNMSVSVFLFPSADCNCGADVRGPDVVRRTVSVPRELRSQIRAMSASFRSHARLIELRAGHGLSF